MPSQRSAWITVPLIMLLFLGGGMLGLRLAEQVAPESGIAAFAGLFMLPMAFAAGLQLWLGFALVAAIGYLMRHLLRLARRAPASAERIVPAMIPPGSFAFLPCGLVCGGAAGLVTGFVASEAGFLMVLFAYLGVGCAYGLLCWQLARNGWLPFPEGS